MRKREQEKDKEKEVCDWKWKRFEKVFVKFMFIIDFYVERGSKNEKIEEEERGR